MTREKGDKKRQEYLRESEERLIVQGIKVGEQMRGYDQAVKRLGELNEYIYKLMERGNLSKDEKEALALWTDLQLSALNKLRESEDLLNEAVRQRDDLQSEVDKVKKELGRS
jgi:hypothetical protein